MTVLASITMPAFSADELVTLRRVEAMLARHPYMRADLGARGEISRELEAVLSARLAVLHTYGAPEAGTVIASLLGKLRAWELELAEAAAAAEEDSERTRLGYETTRLLHPEPVLSQEPQPTTATIEEVTRVWERLHEAQALRSVIAKKIQQSRDFIRHGAMLPLYWIRRRRIRKLLPEALLSHPGLRETLFAIEQIGPLVDNFAFKGKAGLPWNTSVALADLTFLYMQLADEFLDELAAAAGGHDQAGRLVRSVYREDASKRPLWDLSLGHLLAIGVNPEEHTTKFGLSLSALFDTLERLAATIDALLVDASGAIVHSTHLFLHHCFQTYLDEAELCERAIDRRADRMRLQDTGWHFYRKNNMVMMLWLDLRARVLGLDPARHADEIRRWGYLLAAFQIFDDLKDIALDLGKQPSYPLQIAAHEFPSELAWLEGQFGSRRLPVTREQIPEVNLRASGTVRQCMRWSRLIALAHFDNTLLYAWDQRWAKSWTRRRRSFNPPGEAPVERRDHVVDRLVRALLSLRKADSCSTVDDSQLAFALDASAYEGSWQIYLALLPNVRAVYRFATLRMWMSAEEKARAARQLLRRYPRARANALVGLADDDVDHQVAGDRLEAFSKLIEI